MCVTVRGPNFCEYNMNETIKSVTLEIMPRKKQKHSKLGVNCLQKSPFPPEFFCIWSRCCIDGKASWMWAWKLIWKKNWNQWGSGQGIPIPPIPKVIMEINLTFLSAQPLTGTTSVMTRWKPPHFKTSYNYQHPKDHLTPVHTPLLSYLNWKVKVRSCNLWNQDRKLQNHRTAHWSVPGFISSQIFSSISSDNLLL